MNLKTRFLKSKEMVQFQNLGQLFLYSMKKYPTRKCINHHSYNHVYKLTQKYNELLGYYNVGKNDRVCWYANKSAHWLSAMTATWMRGAIFVPLHANNYNLNQYIIKTTKPKIELCDYMVDGVYSNLQPKEHQEEDVMPEDPSMILYTSGSTNQPKGVVLSHQNVLKNLEQIQYCIKDDVYYRDSAFSILPWHHCYGLVCELLYLCMNGAHITIPSSDNPKKMIQEMKWNYPTLFYTVPKVLETLYRNDFNLSSMLKRNLLFGHRIRRISVGGAICHPKLISFMRESYNIPTLQGYGMTETSPMISLNSIYQNRVGSVGKPLKGVEIKMKEDNEILVRGGNVMNGYLRHITKQNQILLEEKDEWFATGDKGYVDANGYLYLYGRTKTEYKLSNGKYVNPVFIEKLLSMSSKIDQAVVFGEGMDHNKIIVYSENKNKSEMLNYIHYYLEDKVQPYEIPQDILFVDEPFTTKNGMLTQKMEPNRHKIIKMYAT